MQPFKNKGQHKSHILWYTLYTFYGIYYTRFDWRHIWHCKWASLLEAANCGITALCDCRRGFVVESRGSTVPLWPILLNRMTTDEFPYNCYLELYIYIYSLILDSSVGLSASIQSAGDLVSGAPGSNPAFSRGTQLVSFRFEYRLPVPEHRN